MTGVADDDGHHGLWRAVRGRCPLCGVRLRRRVVLLVARCTSCGLPLRRERGHHSAVALAVLLATIGLLAIVLLTVAIATAPDVPILGLAASAAAVVLVIPIVGYPVAVGLLLWLDLRLRPLGSDDLAANDPAPGGRRGHGTHEPRPWW
ncbi:hypothetical protein ER308_20275 [Egibacter rhizosphaerae]|uniref:DUF983 domain-containing protein n=1 Tax=Egibacter rhizosphaerae TaxID=1670831 RepID=A0A411YKE9_9ACTN|nr:hypothetical protein [Egibacter rhizosphaerae]QBI21672.1 hypothetical protein ER308_20275 [Egibacter rhizosphaerae]